ncbi:NADPH:quinone oxidoreductase family protein [Fredinandcohnia sp. FSL W7-1320]|uniref:NADPH:quinone oxidoreductase family protein n=1 Tax=Fredinandcohnia sp. FSL W7-1320 TaxID=2954540 RepID=UPI0030FDE05F
MNDTFKAFIVDKTEALFTKGIQEITLDKLPEGDVIIRVKYSSINFKDGLASIPNGRIVRSYPFIPGIDLSGIVVSSESEKFKVGDSVLVTSYDLGMTHFGGFSEYARVPAEWVVPLPRGLTLKESMIFGTAGFTAALSIQRLLESGLTQKDGPVLVTGATGGVGSIAVAILAKLNFHVVASTGKESEHDFLRMLGASEIISREDVTPNEVRPLDKERWAGAIDPVGGNTLASILSHLKYGRSVAVSGLTGGNQVNTTVFPFILRGVNILGIDSVLCPMDTRVKIWEKIASDWKPESLLEIVQEVSLEGLEGELDKILKGKLRGRTVVNLN